MTNKQESCLTAVEKRVGRGRKFGVNRESLAVLQLNRTHVFENMQAVTY